MTVPDAVGSTEIQFPAWNALYQIRDFVRNVQDLTARCDGKAVELAPVDLETWRSPAEPCHELEVRYEVYADEESPFSAILNDGHAFINFAQVLFYLPRGRGRPDRVRFLLPPGWRVATLLEDSTKPGEYLAPDYDALADRPAEAGTFAESSYRERGVTYRYVVYAQPPEFDAKRLKKSLEKITAAETALMRDVPFSRYTFIFHFLPQGGGGMEHADGTVIGFPATNLSSNWEGLESLIAHEFFHAWNVKRIRPQGLEPIDYIHGNDTRDLWFSEGVTSTYGELSLERAGLVRREALYGSLAHEIEDLERRPARHFQSVELSGRDAWLEKYPDYFRPDRSISYYNKGEILGFLLDLAIRHASDNRHSLDDLMRQLDTNFARRGRFFTDADLRAMVAALAGPGFNVGAFFRDDVTGTRELDYDTYLAYAGLRLTRSEEAAPDWGFTAVRAFAGPARVQSVEGANARDAGILAGDVLLRIDGDAVTGLPQESSGFKPGETVEIELGRGSKHVTVELKLESKSVARYRIEEIRGASRDEVTVRRGWLHGTTSEGSE